MVHLWWVVCVFIVWSPDVSASASFPGWLRDKTGLKDWPAPGAPPPYIPEPHHQLKKIKEIPRRAAGDCWSHGVGIGGLCAFDCDGCVAPDDIWTCTPLSQTFDDGPSTMTPKLLDGLQKTRTKTSFFLLGENVVEFPDIVRRQRKEGHLLAVHTWSHQFLPALSNEEVFAEIQWSVWAVNATANVIPRFFRPPYGGTDDRIRNIASQLGLTTVLWNRDTNDWRLEIGTLPPGKILDEVKQWTATTSAKRKWFQARPASSGLILEHDLLDEAVDVALTINKLVGKKQKTVAQCQRVPWYQ